MELKRNLLKVSEKSRFRIILGVGFLILAVAWVVGRTVENQDIRLIDWIYSFLFVSFGIIYTTEGVGIAFPGLFWKAFVAIDEIQISLKPGIFSEARNVYWNDILSVEYNPLNFKFTKMDHGYMILKLSGMDYALIQEIKKIIEDIAHEKGILISS